MHSNQTMVNPGVALEASSRHTAVPNVPVTMNDLRAKLVDRPARSQRSEAQPATMQLSA